MKLCHQALSRSQINAVAKLREAGIVANNLVVLPNLFKFSMPDLTRNLDGHHIHITPA